MSGPLDGIQVIELAGIGPGPFCAMLLGDLGADVIRVDRPPHAASGLPGPLNTLQGRSKRSIAVDLKDSAGIAVVLALVERADVLIEAFRPGVAERLGLGPEDCHVRNPRLVYGRMTGWGQDGPLANRAGHDINYIGLIGALHAIGRAGQRPLPPLNLVADFGGGALYLTVGILAALVERSRSGRGDVIDAAMVDGAASLMLPTYEMLGHGVWSDERGVNIFDGAAPFYDTYETSDGGYMAAGPIEPQFFAEFLERLGLDPAELPSQLDPTGWADLKERVAEIFATRTRDEWSDVFSGSDACVTPVLSMLEAPLHPHNAARETFIEVGGIVEPAPAPRFARSATATPRPANVPGSDSRDILTELGFEDDRIEELISRGVVQQDGGA
jgi:alpha-methylacyl-CoA racemase